MPQRILLGAAATLRATFHDQDGEPATPAADVKVHVTNLAGGDVLAADTAATKSTEAIGGVSVDAGVPGQLDVWTATWTAGGLTTTTEHLIVGGYLFGVAELAAAEPAFATARFTPEALRDARDQAEAEAEQIIGVAFFPRAAKATVLTSASARLELPDREVRTIRSASIAGTALSPAELAAVTVVDNAALRTDGTYWGYQGAGWWPYADVIYEHGLSQPPPDLAQQVMIRCRDLALQLRSGIPQRAQTYSGPTGGTITMRDDGAGRGFDWVGIRSVNNTYNRLRAKFSPAATFA